MPCRLTRRKSMWKETDRFFTQATRKYNSRVSHPPPAKSLTIRRCRQCMCTRARKSNRFRTLEHRVLSIYKLLRGNNIWACIRDWKLYQLEELRFHASEEAKNRGIDVSSCFLSDLGLTRGAGELAKHSLNLKQKSKNKCLRIRTKTNVCLLVYSMGNVVYNIIYYVVYWRIVWFRRARVFEEGIYKRC